MDIGLMDVIKNIAVLGLAAYLTTNTAAFSPGTQPVAVPACGISWFLICIFGLLFSTGELS